jgi:AmmeMemoRadiSam system protein A
MIERERRGCMLLGIARDAIAAAYAEVPARWPEPWLEELAATFVTLRLDGELRGCIGSIEAHRPLGMDVHANARGAAYRDSRFAPVASREVGLLEVEVSVLSRPEPLAAHSEAEALAQLRAGIDGVIVEYQGRRATFLPQVWDGLHDPLDFLAQLRLKAELPARFWHRDLRLSRYTVEKHR